MNRSFPKEVEKGHFKKRKWPDPRPGLVGKRRGVQGGWLGCGCIWTVMGDKWDQRVQGFE